MKIRCIDIFNSSCLEIRNNFLNTQCSRFYNKKIQNKQALRLFVFPILYSSFILIFNCIPVPVCAKEIMKFDFYYKVGGTFPVLPILLIVSLLTIILLSVAFYHYKCRLHSTQEYSVCYINTCKEFIKIIDKMLKRIMFLPLFMLLALPLGAQEKTDSVYEFRFVPRKDMFFIPYGDNYATLQRLGALIDQYREEIADGKIPIYVDGYCNSLSGNADNLDVARIRSNRVKSELVLHNKVNERHFVTRNYAQKGDWVVVRIPVLAPLQARSVPVAVSEAEHPEDGKALEFAENEAVATVETVKEEQPAEEPAVMEAPQQGVYRFSLRANLLRWATLSPDLGIEWRINRHIGILVNGSWTSWSWSGKDRRYALWKVSPEVRYYMGMEKRGFLGAMYHIGEFNYKLGDIGRQGDYQGGGITGGYTLELNRALSLDFHAALGYTYVDYDKYKVIDGVRVRAGSDKKNYWGVNQLGITLVWKLVK